MIKNVRKGVFETNSSSMHSLAIIGSDRMTQHGLTPTTISETERFIVVQPDEFGWSGPRVRTPLDKLSYIVTMIQYHDQVPIAKSRFFQWLSDMVKDYTGFGLYYQKLSDQYYPDGYIDHQSTDTLDAYWSHDEDAFKSNMRDIVFNEKYFIIIDNDNH